jgi:hypothetical protein
VAAEMDDVALDLDVRPVASLESRLLARFAGDRDLMLGADLDARHLRDDKHLVDVV